MNNPLRIFNEQGCSEYQAFLERAKGTTPNDIRESRELLLQSDAYSYHNNKGIHLSLQNFKNRFEAGEYLHETLTGIPELINERGLWAWLSLYYHDSVCPIDPVTSRRKIYDVGRYIPDNSFRRYYRHLLHSPFSIYNAHQDNPERAMAVLCSPVHKPGDVVEGLASRQNLISSNAVMQTATDLYYDRASGNLKQGAASKGRGGSRRFAAIMQQFDLTYDLEQISSNELLKLLPREFDQFKE